MDLRNGKCSEEIEDGEAVKKSNQGDFLIKIRRCRILIRSHTNVWLNSTMPKYEKCYANLRVACMRKP
jgi:hypothetical protein